MFTSNECLALFTPNLFWDADMSELSLDDSARYVIQRVLEHGQMKDWQLLNRYYGLSKIVEELMFAPVSWENVKSTIKMAVEEYNRNRML